MMEGRIADSAFGAFKTAWRRDASVEFLRAAAPVFLETEVEVVESEFPAAVQVHPLLTLELGLRIFGSRYVVRSQEGNTGEYQNSGYRHRRLHTLLHRRSMLRREDRVFAGNRSQISVKTNCGSFVL